MASNYTDSGWTPVQVGQTNPTSGDRDDTPTPPVQDSDTVNVRRGNARVGRQVDTVTGDLNITSRGGAR